MGEKKSTSLQQQAAPVHRDGQKEEKIAPGEQRASESKRRRKKEEIKGVVGFDIMMGGGSVGAEERERGDRMRDVHQKGERGGKKALAGGALFSFALWRRRSVLILTLDVLVQYRRAGVAHAAQRRRAKEDRRGNLHRAGERVGERRRRKNRTARSPRASVYVHIYMCGWQEKERKRNGIYERVLSTCMRC